jgi:hypothetical protein
MPIVKMPDGQLVDMPDNPSPELLQRFRDHYATMNQPKVEQPAIEATQPVTNQNSDRLIAAHNRAFPEMVNAADTGLRKGILGLANLGWQTGKKLGENLKPYLPQVPEGPFKDAVVKARDTVHNYLNPEDPKTNTGKVMANLIASTSGGMIAPGNMGNNAAMGLSGGIGAETAAHIFGDNPVTRVLGSIAGSGIHGLATKEYLNRPTLAREMLSDVNNDDLATAIKNQKADFDRGIPTTLSQAMPTASNIDTYTDALANSSQGVNVAKILRDQPYRVSRAVEDELATLPGQQVGAHTMANRVQEAATDVIKNANNKASQTWVDTFNEAAKTAGKEVPTDTIKSVVKDILDKRSNYAQKDSEYKVLTQLANRFAEHNPTTKKPEFITDAAKLHRTLKDFKSTLTQENLANKGLSTSVDKFIGGVVNEVKAKLGESLEPYAKANTAYAKAKESVNELKASEIGRLAGRRGAIPGVEASMAPIHNLFKAGTTPGAPSEILHAADKFIEVSRGKDFVDAAKSYLADNISKAGASNNSRINDNIAENLTKVFGVPERLDARSQGTKDILEGMFKANGETQYKQAAEGFRRLMTTVARAARRPDTVAGTNKASIENLAEKSIGKNIGQVSIITPLRQPMLAYARYLKSDALTAMDKMLTDPDQVANLILLGKQPTMNQNAQKAMMAVISANVAAHHSNLEDK